MRRHVLLAPHPGTARSDLAGQLFQRGRVRLVFLGQLHERGPARLGFTIVAVAQSLPAISAFATANRVVGSTLACGCRTFDDVEPFGNVIDAQRHLVGRNAAGGQRSIFAIADLDGVGERRPGVKNVLFVALTSRETAGGVLPAMMSSDAVALPPAESVTVRVAAYVPFLVERHRRIGLPEDARLAALR